MRKQEHTEVRYSRETLICELVRRDLLTIEEARYSLISGLTPDQMGIDINFRILCKPETDIPGRFKVESAQELLKQFLEIKFQIYLSLSN